MAETKKVKIENPNKPEERHLFIGGWQNFDMDYFLKRHSRAKLRNKNAKS